MRTRKNIRLQNYDYSLDGAYYVTICTKGKLCLFGNIVDEIMRLNKPGIIVRQCWSDLVNHYSNIELDAFIVMPNHVHGIVVLNNVIDVGAGFKPARDKARRAGLKPAPTVRMKHDLPEVMRALKTFSAKKINNLRGTQGNSIWQRNYYEHVIRNESDLEDIREYIFNNPTNWESDKYYG